MRHKRRFTSVPEKPGNWQLLMRDRIHGRATFASTSRPSPRPLGPARSFSNVDVVENRRCRTRNVELPSRREERGPGPVDPY